MQFKVFINVKVVILHYLKNNQYNFKLTVDHN